jgi:hypothetical protein
MKKYIIFVLLVLFSHDFVLAQNDPCLKSNNPDFKGYKVKNFWQLTLQTGFMVPVGKYMTDNYYNSVIIGADVAYKVNTEVGLFAEVGYIMLSPKDTLGPSQGYINLNVGPRVYFRPVCYRSSFFIEAGVGPFLHIQSSYTTPTGTFDSKSEFRMGANAGIGGELVLTNSLFITLKCKINSIFYPFGSTTYMSSIGGFTIRL